MPREMNQYGNVLTSKLPWWMSIIVVIGLGEIAWFAQTVIYGTKQSAVTTTEIHQLQSGQAALTASLTTLDSDVQTLNVNVAVLTQQIKDDRGRRNGQ